MAVFGGKISSFQRKQPASSGVFAKEKVTFVVNSGMVTGLLAILVPFLIAAAQGPREFQRLPVPRSR